MRPDPDLTAVAALLADASRMSMLDALMGGGARSGQELARVARVTPQTASGHLARLVKGGLVSVRPEGKRRLYSLAGPEVAHLMEALSLVSPAAPEHLAAPRSQREAIRAARTCYDHLAGALGVAVTDTLVRRRILLLRDQAFSLTAAGERWCETEGIALDPLRTARRPLVRACLDWSERRPHLAGAVGAALCVTWLERGYVVRVRGCRALRLTDRGREKLASLARGG